MAQTSLYRSVDGGHTFISFKGAPGGDDNHALWIDPTDSTRMIMASDQGATISMDSGAELEQLVQPADSAGLPHVDRQPLAVLGVWNAAGQRQRRDAEPRRLRRDHDARLGPGGGV